LDQKPGIARSKLGSNTDRGYADAEPMHGLESSYVTNTNASRVAKLNATRRKNSRMIYLKKLATPEKNVCCTDSRPLSKYMLKFYKKKYIT